MCGAAFSRAGPAPSSSSRAPPHHPLSPLPSRCGCNPDRSSSCPARDVLTVTVELDFSLQSSGGAVCSECAVPCVVLAPTHSCAVRIAVHRALHCQPISHAPIRLCSRANHDGDCWMREQQHQRRRRSVECSAMDRRLSSARFSLVPSSPPDPLARHLDSSAAAASSGSQHVRSARVTVPQARATRGRT